MDVKLGYKVHSSNVETSPMEVTVNGATVTALVDQAVVELVASNGDHGHTFRLPVTGADAYELAKKFKVDDEVILTITVISGG